MYQIPKVSIEYESLCLIRIGYCNYKLLCMIKNKISTIKQNFLVKGYRPILLRGKNGKGRKMRSKKERKSTKIGKIKLSFQMEG